MIFSQRALKLISYKLGIIVYPHFYLNIRQRH